MSLPDCCPCCQGTDLDVVTDYGRGDGRATCHDCGAAVYRVDGAVIFADACTVRAARAAENDVQHAVESDA